MGRTTPWALFSDQRFPCPCLQVWLWVTHWWSSAASQFMNTFGSFCFIWVNALSPFRNLWMIWSVVLIHLTGYQLQARLSPEPFSSQFRLASDSSQSLFTQLRTTPQPIHFTSDVRSNFGWVNHQQCFVVGVSGMGDQLKLPVITGLLSITVNLWCMSLRRSSQWVFSGMTRHSKLESKLLSRIGRVDIE